MRLLRPSGSPYAQAVEGDRADRVGQAVVRLEPAWPVPLHDRADHAEQEPRRDGRVNVGPDVPVAPGPDDQVGHDPVELPAAGPRPAPAARLAPGPPPPR